MTEYVDIWPSEWFLQMAVANVGPISAGIDASHASFQVQTSLLTCYTIACVHVIPAILMVNYLLH